MALLRIATANLLHGMSLTDGRADPAVLAASATDLGADVVGLQEVDRLQERSGGVDQTAEVARALGCDHWRFVPAVLGTPGPVRTWTVAGEDDAVGSDLGTAGLGRRAGDGPSYGVGMVSRFPVASWSARRFRASRLSLPLAVPATPRPRLMMIPDEPRIGLAAVIDGPAGRFTVITAHLSFVPGTNVRQLRSLARWALEFPAPRLLIGDFNLPGPLPPRITGWATLARTPTYPSPAPRVQFDHMLGDGIALEAVRSARAVHMGVSDHRALVLELELPEH